MSHEHAAVTGCLQDRGGGVGGGRSSLDRPGAVQPATLKSERNGAMKAFFE